MTPKVGSAPAIDHRPEITTFNVPAITDAVRRESLYKALTGTEGVVDVTINTAARLVQVKYDERIIEAYALKRLIEAEGFLVQRYSDGER